MYFSTFIVKPCEVHFSPVFSLVAFFFWGGGRDHSKGDWGEMMQGNFKQSPRTPTQPNPHAITHACTHSQTFSHTLFMQEKNILTFALQNSTRASV